MICLRQGFSWDTLEKLWSKLNLVKILCYSYNLHFSNSTKHPQDKFMFMYKIVCRSKTRALSKTCNQIQMGWSQIKSKSTNNNTRKTWEQAMCRPITEDRRVLVDTKAGESMRHRWREWAITEVWNLTWGTKSNRGSTREPDSVKPNKESNTEAETGFSSWVTEFTSRSVNTDPLQAERLRLRNDTFQAY